MDKNEYQDTLSEISAYMKKREYRNALLSVEKLDWKREKSIRVLNLIADVYEANQDYREARDVLEAALGRVQVGKGLLGRLVEVCIKSGELDDAEAYYNRFVEAAANDDAKYVLQYKLFRAKSAPLEAQISVLEEYRDHEYTEKWVYELAALYAKSGDIKKCVETCDDLFLWFGEGKYVFRALELKMKYEPLTSSQKKRYSEEQGKYAGREKMPGVRTPDTSSPEQMREKVSEGIHEVFQGIPRKQDKTASREKEQKAKLENTVPLDLLHISDLEPEKADTEVIPSRKEIAEEMVLRKPETSRPKEEKKSAPETEKIWSDIGINPKKKEEKAVDLDALLKETAGSFSKEISSGGFETKEEPETEEPEIVPKESEPEAEEEIPSLESEKELEEQSAQPEITLEARPETPKKKRGWFFGKRKHNEEPEEEAVEEKPETVPEPEKAEAEKTQPEPEKPESVPEPETEAAGAGAERPVQTQADNPVQAEEKAEERPEEKADEKASGAGDENKPVFSAFRASIRAALEENSKEQEHKGDTASFVSELRDEKRKPLYNEDLEVPDPVLSDSDKRSHSKTLDLSKVGENTIPVSLDELISSETPEERRIRFLNRDNLKMSEEQRRIFTYFARVPGMDNQILSAMTAVYQHVDEHNSVHGNLAVMGAEGSGKSTLTRDLVTAMCADLGMKAAKTARITGFAMNHKDAAEVVAKMAGGFLMIEECSDMNDNTVDRLNKAMEFRTDRMILILEDEKAAMRAFLTKHPEFAKKIERVLSIPIFTNDELITFARTYAEENKCKLDDMAVLALYTIIGNNQSYEEPMTIARVKGLIDAAISKAKSSKRRKRSRKKNKNVPRDILILEEKDFDKN